MTETGKGSAFTRCDRCGRDNSCSLRFCQDCGNRLVPASVDVIQKSSAAPLACSQCGVGNAEHGRFCVNCGAPLKGTVSAAPAATASFAPGPPAPLQPTIPRPPLGRPAPSLGAPPPFGSPLPIAPRPPIGAPPRPAAAPEADTVAAAPVVPLGDRGAPLTEPPIACSRCRGSNARHMTFCQFCGARLTAEASIPPPIGNAAGAAGAFPSALEPARLVVIAQDGTPGRHYPLEEPQIDIGREEGAILLPSDPYVSPRHARILRKEGRIFVRDLASVNGVYVRIRAAEQLQHADLVLIGLEVLRFEVVSDAEKGLGPATERGTRVFGSPALPRYARLCQRTVEGATRDVFYLGREETVVGRESGDLVFTNDPFMSRRHATFHRDPATNQFSLRDLGSSNGTYLAVRGDHALESGDHVRIGQHLFRLDVETGRTRP